MALSGCAHVGSLRPEEALTPQERQQALGRARAWAPTHIGSIDFKAGPAMPGAFASNAWVTCEYKKKLTGQSPKFVCETSPGYSVGVKYGVKNAEIFGQVLSPRLFWALGFLANPTYPVRIRCHGGSKDPWNGPEPTGEVAEFELAIVERRLRGRAMETTPDSRARAPRRAEAARGVTEPKARSGR